jgi:hypothetical protein
MGVGPPQRECCPNFWHDSLRLNPKLWIKRRMLCQNLQKKITNPVDNLHLSENLTLQELRQRRRIRLKDLVQKVHHSNLETCECTSTILQLQRPDDKQTTWAAEEDSNKKTGWIKMTNIWDDDSSTTQQKANIQFQPCTKKNDTNIVFSSQQTSLSNALLLQYARIQLAMGVGPPQRERCPNFWHDSLRLNPKL